MLVGAARRAGAAGQRIQLGGMLRRVRHDRDPTLATGIDTAHHDVARRQQRTPVGAVDRDRRHFRLGTDVGDVGQRAVFPPVERRYVTLETRQQVARRAAARLHHHQAARGGIVPVDRSHQGDVPAVRAPRGAAELAPGLDARRNAPVEIHHLQPACDVRVVDQRRRRHGDEQGAAVGSELHRPQRPLDVKGPHVAVSRTIAGVEVGDVQAREDQLLFEDLLVETLLFEPFVASAVAVRRQEGEPPAVGAQVEGADVGLVLEQLARLAAARGDAIQRPVGVAVAARPEHQFVVADPGRAADGDLTRDERHFLPVRVEEVELHPRAAAVVLHRAPRAGAQERNLPAVGRQLGRQHRAVHHRVPGLKRIGGCL